MLAKPEGEWGMPPEMVAWLTGYGPVPTRTSPKRRRSCRSSATATPSRCRSRSRRETCRPTAIPRSSSPTSSRRSTSSGDLDFDTPRWYARLAKKDYTIGLNVTGVSVDDPDGNIVENYSCQSERNYTQYCNADVDKLLAAQSRELDREKRKKIVWDIERILVEDAARPIILHSAAGNCWQPYVKGYTPHDNSQYNYVRYEDVWLDK